MEPAQTSSDEGYHLPKLENMISKVACLLKQVQYINLSCFTRAAGATEMHPLMLLSLKLMAGGSFIL